MTHEEIYQHFSNDEEPWWHVSYEEIYTLFGNILLYTEIGYYQGDAFIALQKGVRFGFGMTGYGSCGGCDLILSCRNYEEFFAVLYSLEQEIMWFDSPQELLDYLHNKDWEGSWAHANIDEIAQEFIAPLVHLLQEKGYEISL